MHYGMMGPAPSRPADFPLSKRSTMAPAISATVAGSAVWQADLINAGWAAT
jgi:hypothetical protein